MTSYPLPRVRAAAAAAAAAALLAAGCGSEDTEPVPPPATTAAPAPAPAAGDGGDAVPQHVIDSLTAEELGCVRQGQPAEASAVTEQALVGCVGVERALLLFSGAADDPAEASDSDPPVDDPDGDPPVDDPVDDPDHDGDHGDGSGGGDPAASPPVDDPDRDAALFACLLETLPIEEIAAWTGDDPADSVAAAEAMIGCDPAMFVDLLIEEAGLDAATVDAGTRECLSDAVAGIDLSGDDAAAAVLAAGLGGCGLPADAVARLFVGGDSGPLTAAQRAASQPIEVGEPVAGELAAGDAAVVYSVALHDARAYRIGVEPGTLDDPAVTLYDSDGEPLAHNDDASPATYAALVEFTPAVEGVYYVAVSGWGDSYGAYTVTVSDHAGG